MRESRGPEATTATPAATVAPAAAAPGRQSLADGAVQMKADGSPMASAAPPPTGSGGAPTFSAGLQSIQLKGAGGGGDAEVHAAAEQGTSGSPTALPHGAAIQQAFGKHDVSGIQAHVGGPAAQATKDMGANAYAVGNKVAFGAQPDLHTAAHEAAHVVQQKQGVSLKGGVGASGDAYEKHADAVADHVVAGKSAEGLLDAGAGSGGAGASTAVQRDDIHSQRISETTDTGNQYSQNLSLNRTQNSVTVSLGIKWVKTGTWASDDAFHAFVDSVKATVLTYVNGKFKIVATPAATGAPSGAAARDISISFTLPDDTSGYQIECYGATNGTSGMTQAGGKLYERGLPGQTAIPPITFAHEFGHCLLGASDEYANPALPGRTISNDHSIMGNFYSQGIAQAEFKVRHFNTILSTVGAQYPGYTCALRPV